MTIRETHDTRKSIDARITYYSELLDEAKKERALLCKECSHDLVLKCNRQDITENSRYGIKVTEYYCPACSSTRTIYEDDISNNPFENTTIIDLTGTYINDYYEFYRAVSEYIFTYYKYFYIDAVPVADKTQRIIEMISSMNKKDSPKTYAKEKI